MITESKGRLRPGIADDIRGGPVHAVLDWIQNSDRQAQQDLAEYLPMFLLPQTQVRGGSTGPLAQAALDVLDGQALPSEGQQTLVWTFDTLAVAIRQVPSSSALEVAVVLDDAQAALGEDRRQAWRQWLALSNQLNLRQSATTITTREHLASEPVVDEPGVAVGVEASAGQASAVEQAMAADWAEAVELGSAVEAALLRDLHRRSEGRLPAPEVGEEVLDGIPLSMSWAGPKVTVIHDGLTEQDQEDLTSAGWTLVASSAELLLDALAVEGAN